MPMSSPTNPDDTEGQTEKARQDLLSAFPALETMPKNVARGKGSNALEIANQASQRYLTGAKRGILSTQSPVSEKGL